MLLQIFLPTQLRAETTVDTASQRPAQTIRNVTILVKDLFEEENLGSFYSTANSLKVNTRQEVVERELLFKAGDKYDAFVVEESERAVRALPFLRRVAITALPDGDFVDIVVSVQDTWTLIPQFSFSIGGGSDKKSIGLAETNILGTGKRAEALFADDEGRKKIEGVWDDRQVWGTNNRLVLGYFDRSDGYRTVGFLGRPFRSLVSPYSWSVNTDFADTISRLFEASEERYIYRNKHEEAQGRFILSSGEANELVQRYGLGYAYELDNFTQADASDFDDVDLNPADLSQDPSLLAEDRKFSGPLVSYERIEPEFISLNYIDKFERVEDFNIGNRFSFQGTYAAEILDSKENTFLLSLADGDGLSLSPTSFVRGELGVSTRMTSSEFDNTLFRGEGRYYNVLGATYLAGLYLGKHTIASNVRFDFGEGLDRDREFVLGASSGLRGYKNRTFAGSKRFVMNIEDRFHLVEDLFRLVNVGGAFFADLGGISRAAVGDIFDDNLYSNIGFGLRFGLPRASGGGVLRVDISFPLRDGPDGSNQFEPRILISTGQIFNSRMSSESVGAVEANVGTGFDR